MSADPAAIPFTPNRAYLVQHALTRYQAVASRLLDLRRSADRINKEWNEAQRAVNAADRVYAFTLQAFQHFSTCAELEPGDGRCSDCKGHMNYLGLTGGHDYAGVDGGDE